MAACCQEQSADYFSPLPVQSAKDTDILKSSLSWEQDPASELSHSPAQCDSSYSTVASPTESTTAKTPGAYNLPQDDAEQEFTADQIFNFGSCDDWANWDDPADDAGSGVFVPLLKMESSAPNMMGLELQPAAHHFRNQSNGADDVQTVFEDTPMDTPLFQLADQPRENLYSTPLSWSPPSGTTSIRSPETYNFAPTLSPRQQSRLIAQAMPSRSRAYPPSPSTASSSEPEHNAHDLKRKNSKYASDDEDEDSLPTTSNESHPPVKKTAHNMIEKRYRTNLNDKIAALRDSVPSLRIITKKNSRGEDAEEDLDGLTPAHKLNKATILSKATEYIAHVERRNRMLTKENAALRSRIQAFEMLMMAQDPTAQQRLTLPQGQRNDSNLSRQTSNSMYGME